VDKTDKTPRPIAALLYLATIRIENPVTKIRPRLDRLFHQQNLVAANAEMPVGNKPHLLRGQLHTLIDAVNHHEVVAETVHFCEF
jgi:hypothetical protein